MREERVILEDGVDVPPVGRHALRRLAEDLDVAAFGCSKPAIRRRHVVLPEPDGPSIEKNSPLPTVRLTSSTARTFAEVPRDILDERETCRVESVHGDRSSLPPEGEGSPRRQRVRRLRVRRTRPLTFMGRRPLFADPSTARQSSRCSWSPSGNRARIPLWVPHSATGVFQKAILSKLPRPLVSQPASVSSALPLQAAGTRRHRAEPRREVALELRIERMLQPHVGAVRMRGVGMHHGRVGPAGRTLLGTVLAIGCFSDCSRLTWNGQDEEATTPSLVKSSIWTKASCQ